MARSRVLVLVLLVMACFAANSLITRWLVSERLLDPAAVTITRFAAGAGMLAAILLLQRRVREALPRAADLPAVGLLAGYALAIAYGYRFITAAAGTFVFYALVIATMTLGGGRPHGRGTIGALLALGGVAVLALGRVEGSTLLGVGLLALTGATWGGYSLALRRGGAPLAANARALCGVALALPLLAWIERDALVWTPLGVAMGLAMGAFTTALAYALWARVLPQLSPLEAGTMQLSVPVLTAAAGVMLLHEPFTAQLALAALLVLSGMTLTIQRRRAAR